MKGLVELKEASTQKMRDRELAWAKVMGLHLDYPDRAGKKHLIKLIAELQPSALKSQE
jgi:hypothetical protein